jgi:hypothetical protein
MALVLLSVSPAAAGETLGSGVPLERATPIETLLASPEAFLGKTVRVDGEVAAVCTNMGCWMELKDTTSGKSLVMKVDDGVIVFPVSARGKRASAQGVFEKVEAIPASSHEKHHDTEPSAQAHEAEHARQAEIGYRVKATGAIIY